MKNLLGFLGIVTILLLIFSGNAYPKSKENKAVCERWCNEHKPECAFCDSAAFCKGRTYDVIKSFKKGTGNWYACGLSKYGNESRKNKEDCEAWCKDDKRCGFCKSSVGCGAKYTAIKMFGGRGKNWYACAKPSNLSDLRKQECEKWCEEHRDSKIFPCIKCSSATGCGKGYRVAKRFQGKGKNWNACEYISSRGDCEEYCKETPECAFCSGNPGCGAGYRSMKTFRGISDRMPTIGFGVSETIVEYLKKNSYACKKK